MIITDGLKIPTDLISFNLGGKSSEKYVSIFLEPTCALLKKIRKKGIGDLYNIKTKNKTILKSKFIVLKLIAFPWSSTKFF
jgi:hypothetical protein